MVYSLVCPRSFCHVCYLKESTPTEIYTLSLHDALPILRTMLSLKLWLAVDWLCQSFDILYHTDTQPPGANHRHARANGPSRSPAGCGVQYPGTGSLP